MSILGTRPWLALELLRRGGHLIGNSNPITVVIMIEKESHLDWVSVSDRVLKLLKNLDCAYVVVEIGRGTINTAAEKDPSASTRIQSTSATLDKHSPTKLIQER